MKNFIFKNNDTLCLKAIKHSSFASQETHCFQASVYLNNKKIGVVGNEGYGGCDNFDGDYKLWQELDNRYKREADKWEFEGNQLESTLEMWCCDAVNAFLSEKDFKRVIKSKVCYIDNGKIYTSTFKGVKKVEEKHINHIAKKHPTAVILNNLNVIDALALWCKS
jgi:hypothetical protein